MPINLRVFRWDEQSGDPEEWRRLRRRWDRLHRVRIVLDVAGFVVVDACSRQPLSGDCYSALGCPAGPPN
jgi:hypothetical protein